MEHVAPDQGQQPGVLKTCADGAGNLDIVGELRQSETDRVYGSLTSRTRGRDHVDPLDGRKPQGAYRPDVDARQGCSRVEETEAFDSDGANGAIRGLRLRRSRSARSLQDFAWELDDDAHQSAVAPEDLARR